MSLDGTAYFDGRVSIQGELQRLDYLGKAKMPTGEELNQGQAIFESCATDLQNSLNLDRLRETILVSLVLSCLNERGWTIVHNEVVLGLRQSRQNRPIGDSRPQTFPTAIVTPTEV